MSTHILPLHHINDTCAAYLFVGQDNLCVADGRRARAMRGPRLQPHQCSGLNFLFQVTLKKQHPRNNIQISREINICTRVFVQDESIFCSVWQSGLYSEGVGSSCWLDGSGGGHPGADAPHHREGSRQGERTELGKKEIQHHRLD